MVPRLLSIVVPAYNEEKRISGTLKQIKDFFGLLGQEHEIIVVDDGSTDGTGRILASGPHMAQLITNPANKGKGYSVRRGALAARGDYVLFTDADLSTPLEHYRDFISHMEQSDIIIASRNAKGACVIESQPGYRVLAGKIYPMLAGLLVAGIHDSQCGFKMFSMPACRPLFEMQTVERFGFDVELLYLAKKHNLRIKEIGVRWVNNPDSRLNLLKDSSSMLADLIRIKANDIRGKYDP